MNARKPAFDDAAWGWVLRQDADDWSPADEAALADWLAADPRHAGALLQAEAMWLAMGDAEAGVEQEPIVLPIAKIGRRRLLAGGVSALAASLVGGLVFFPGSDRYATQIGEIRQVPLADGSIAAINTDSRIAVRIAENRRDVELQIGEAWFQVARDGRRPFTVASGQVRVRAVGTAFSVRRHANGSTVGVTEGVIEAWAETGATRPVRLSAGESAFVANDARVQRFDASQTSIERTLAWRSGKIDFVNRPVKEAIAEFNRYNRRQIVMNAPAIGRAQFDGVFRADDPEGFARAVRDSFGARLDLSDPHVIRIVPTS